MKPVCAPWLQPIFLADSLPSWRTFFLEKPVQTLAFQGISQRAGGLPWVPCYLPEHGHEFERFIHQPDHPGTSHG